MWRGRPRPRLLKLILILIPAGSLATAVPWLQSTRARAPAPHHFYFANTIDAGATLMVAATVLPGSPPPSGLMVNLVMFFDV